MAPVPVEPSPKSQAYDAMVPSGSLDVLPSNDTPRFATVEVNAATGGWLGGGACTVMLLVMLVDADLSSVTVSFTAYVPAVA